MTTARAATGVDLAARRLAIYRLAAEMALDDCPESMIVQALAIDPITTGMTTDELRDVARRVCAEYARRTHAEVAP